jgi:GNAT superfamily N-acetyltransferase
MSQLPRIASLSANEAEPALEALSDILVDCVTGGASVSFMLPFGLDDARAFWRKIVADVARGDRVLFGATLDGRLVGTVQLGLAGPPNQTHRADIAKLLVHRAARGRGLARALMTAAEAEAKARGRTLLTMDTASGTAERLYLDLGYVRVGVIPGYARLPDGPLCDTTVFYKQIA